MVNVIGNRVTFKFFRPHAHQVSVLGDFNNWRRGEIPMRKTSGGVWQVDLHLPPGSFKFRYECDGQTFIDYAAFGLEPGPYGLDSLVLVKPPQPAALQGQAAE